MKRGMAILLTAAAAGTAVAGGTYPVWALDDGYYSAEFNTDSTLFHVNEMYDGLGTLRIEDGVMTIHIVMPSKSVLNLFVGTAEDAEKDGAVLIDPVVEEVMYTDGTVEEVHAFDLPVPYLSEPYEVALIGEHGKWYDHRVTITNPEPIDELYFDLDEFEDLGEFDLSEDQVAADEAAFYIDLLCTEPWSEETAEQCAAAKAAWDSLTEEQRALVEGEAANPDYFGLETGDPALDDPRNGDDIGDNEILVVSTGTAYNSNRAAELGAVENALAERFPDWSVRRAFSSQSVINQIRARDGEEYAIDNLRQALQRAADNGVKKLVIQPTCLMHGSEFSLIRDTVAKYADSFECAVVAEPLLGALDEDISVINEEKKAVCEAMMQAALSEAGYESAAAAADDGTAVVFVGEDDSNTAKVSYVQMAAQLKQLGYTNAYVGSVDGDYEDLTCGAIMDAVAGAGFSKVILRPVETAADALAYVRIAGSSDESWKSRFEGFGAFGEVECQLEGLGGAAAVSEVFAGHVSAAMAK